MLCWRRDICISSQMASRQCTWMFREISVSSATRKQWIHYKRRWFTKLGDAVNKNKLSINNVVRSLVSPLYNLLKDTTFLPGGPWRFPRQKRFFYDVVDFGVYCQTPTTPRSTVTSPPGVNTQHTREMAYGKEWLLLQLDEACTWITITMKSQVFFKKDRLNRLKATPPPQKKRKTKLFSKTIKKEGTSYLQHVCFTARWTLGRAYICMH
jgi:hypothetical protein